MNNISIIGAGLSGLIAACLTPSAVVFEASTAKQITHKALLRFRTNQIGEATGIAFKPVAVRKGIWDRGEFHQPNIKLANQYAIKTVGYFQDRSIWNIETATRFIAPEDLAYQLADAVAHRVEYGTNIVADDVPRLQAFGPIISTMPLPTLLTLLGLPGELNQFRYSPIVVDRFRLYNSDVYQTIYYPDPSNPVYRATLTGPILTIESVSVGLHSMMSDAAREVVLESFNIHPLEIETIELNHKQRFGKISPIDADIRRALMYRLSSQFGIYSLGRFATWRNILLDDVYHDLSVVKGLMRASQYAKSLHYAEERL